MTDSFFDDTTMDSLWRQDEGTISPILDFDGLSFMETPPAPQSSTTTTTPSQAWKYYSTMAPTPLFKQLVTLHHQQEAKLLQPTTTYNLVTQALGPDAWIPLSRPIVNPKTKTIVVGTENSVMHGPTGGGRQVSGLIIANNKDAQTKFVATQHPVRDLVWIDRAYQACMYVTDGGLGIYNFQTSTLLNQQPSDYETLRQIAVDSTFSLVAGGGGNSAVFVGLLADERNGLAIQQTISTHDVVGSVSWLHNEPMVISFTTDTKGTLGLIDARENNRIVVSASTGLPGLYAHVQLRGPQFTFACGFGSGLISVLDLRMNRTVALASCPPSSSGATSYALGDLVLAADNTTLFGFGMGGITRWSTAGDSVTCTGFGNPLPSYTSVALPQHMYKTCGVNYDDGEGKTILVTDSAGYVSMWSVV
jgi:hypothetical protein